MILALLQLCAALALLPACRRGVPKPNSRLERVVSLSPSTTEAMFALGEGGMLVGRSRFCDFPPEAARLPVVGGFVDASLETIVALRPDLVVGAQVGVTHQGGLGGVAPEPQHGNAGGDRLVGLHGPSRKRPPATQGRGRAGKTKPPGGSRRPWNGQV